VVEAVGLLFPAGLVPDAAAQRRILALWTPGCAVYRTPAGLLAVFPTPMRLRCERAAGTPVVRSGGLLLAAPLTPKETTQLLAPEGSLVVCRAGTAAVIP